MNRFKLKILENTFLKFQPLQTSALTADQKYEVKAGEEYPIRAFAEEDDIHFRVAFGSNSDGQQISFPGPGGESRNTWLIFEGHCMVVESDGTPAPLFVKSFPLKLQDFLTKDLRFDVEAIAANKVLATQIQTRLIDLGLLSSTADSRFGPISTAALKRFQELMKCEEVGFLGRSTAEKLIETKPEDIPKPPLRLGNNLASRIIKYMKSKNYRIATGEREFNIVYVEGMDADGRLNGDRPNEFNDRRFVIEFKDGVPEIVGNWEATTEPGNYYTQNPYNPTIGAARIQFGQYKAWRIGIHGKAEPHRSLVQVASVNVHRDLNKDYQRANDWIQTGDFFAINQHHGFDHPQNDIYNASAGCLVGRTRQGHTEFLTIIEQDSRYLATPYGAPVHLGDPNERTYVFDTTIIWGNELVKQFPAS